MSAVTVTERAKRVLVYDDRGMDHQSPSGFVEGFQEVLDAGIKVERVKAETLRTPGWEENTLALVFGAGAPSVWDESLGDDGRKNIYNYVAGGGSYFGACSGAMFASEISHFEEQNKKPLIKKRGIDFLPGRAVGPLIPAENYRSPSSATAERVTFSFGKKLKFAGRLYTQGGCYFEPSSLDPSRVRILGTYKNAKPAAVFCRVGQGRAFLMGSHIEFSPKPLQAIPIPRIAKLAKTLAAHELFRKAMFIVTASVLRLPLRRI